MEYTHSFFIRLLILWEVALFSPAFSFKLEAQSQDISLIPNKATAITLLNITPEVEKGEGASLFHIRVECSPAAQSAFKFEPYEHLCAKFGFRGTLAEINQALSTVQITSPLLQNNKAVSIEYVIWRDQSPADAQSLLQTFHFEDSLKLTVLKEKITLKYAKGLAIEQRIAVIDERFVEPNAPSQFEIELIDESKPQWLDFRFVQGDLVLIGQPPQDVQFDRIISFIVIDKHSGLASQLVTLGVSTAENQMSSNYFIGFVVFFAAFCLIMISIVIAFLIKISGEPSILKEQPMDFDSSIVRNVLSDSITNWSHDNHSEGLDAFAKPSAFGRLNEGRDTGFSDSILEMETLQHDIGSKSAFDDIPEQSFAVDNSFTYIIEFGNISRIGQLSDNRSTYAKPA